MTYLDSLTDEQRAILLKPMNWKEATTKLEVNLKAAKPKYRPGIEHMLRIARAKAGQ